MNVKVKANFKLVEDENVVGIVELVASARYSIPDMNGFRKSKAIEVVVHTSSSLTNFLHDSERYVMKAIAKKAIQKEVRLDIMNRLKTHVQLSEKEQLSQVLNMLNQMKFDFDFDVQAVKSDIREEKCPKRLDATKFGQVQGDYFNLHSKGKMGTW